MSACIHLTTHRERVESDSTAGCSDCLREGTSWVHLRQCLDCGHIACCDSSPRRHADAHFRAVGHPVVQSFEPDESWLWCYADAQMAQSPA